LFPDALYFLDLQRVCTQSFYFGLDYDHVFQDFDVHLSIECISAQVQALSVVSKLFEFKSLAMSEGLDVVTVNADGHGVPILFSLGLDGVAVVSAF